ncbi:MULTISPECIES: hypothetical protein [Burkholderia]|uniref:hypothetical protein n=1 Tax=Burkholderia TaxID=32008 RepID=UPI0009C18A01|nr:MULTISPECIES: hypothetical protein [Burkholderia]MCA8394931.1 DUF4276 family protein [Burkholderia vietnamiensis]
MHIEVLVEDSSGACLLEILLPRIIGAQGEPHTWRVHPYKGIGRIPKGLASKTDPAKRALLDQLPRLLKGYGKTPGTDAVAVIVDSDSRDPRAFLRELNNLLDQCNPAPTTLFSLAIEEMEAWLLGDANALWTAFPRAKKDVLARYKQDSVCGTWELLADAVHKGGKAAIHAAGWPAAGEMKHEWARQIGMLMDVNNNASDSFCQFRDGLKRLVA